MATVPGNGQQSLADDTATTSKSAAALHDLIDDVTREIFQWVCCAVLGQILALLGIVTNVMNICCFVKQGFRDTVNISLLGDLNVVIICVYIPN